MTPRRFLLDTFGTIGDGLPDHVTLTGVPGRSILGDWSKRSGSDNTAGSSRDH